MAKRGGGGGMMRPVFRVFYLLALMGLVLGWARINNVHDFKTAYDYFKGVADKTRDCGAENLQWNCDTSLGSGRNNSTGEKTGGGGGGNSSTQSRTNGGGSNGGGSNSTNGDSNGGGNNSKGSSNSGVSPYSPTAINVNAIKSDADKSSLISALQGLKTGDEQKVDYERSQWRHWIGAPCDTRKTVLIAQGKNVQVTKTASKCSITSGVWTEPYAGKTITDSKKLDIDHVIPLGYAASHGGQSWSPEKKQSFANDVTQLVAADASANRAKSDKGPKDWMPKQDFQCQYSKIWVATAAKYGVVISFDDRVVLQNTLQKCSK